MIGKRLAHYEILERIGSGGMGEVFRARDTKLGRSVAIKMLPEAWARDDERAARFQREGRLLASLSHPNIASIHDVAEEEGVPFLVLELVPGETLAEKLRQGPIPLDEALNYAGQILDALEAAHEQGIIHRDLKPLNIKIRPGNRITVLDFGLAKALMADAPSTDETTTASFRTEEAGGPLGTAAYMSPEQARSEPVDMRTDLWAFGCILYEMVTGARAFAGKTSLETLAAVLEREPDWAKLPKTTPAELRALVSSCLSKSMDLRPKRAADVRRIVEKSLREARRDKEESGDWSLASAVRSIFSRRSRPPAATIARQPTLRQVTFEEGLQEFPAWSPDGRSLVYTAEIGGLRKIFRREIEGQERTQLTHGEFDDIHPTWSPDGKSILFIRSQKAREKLEPGDVFGQFTGADVWSLDLSSGRESRVVENASRPVFSPDGSRIAFDAPWVGPHRIWVAESSGRNPRQVTTDTSEAVVHINPAWSPDGSRLVFQNIEKTNFDIRTVDVRTGETQWISRDLIPDVNPVWSPSGRFIYFTSLYRSGGLNVWRVPLRGHEAAGAPEQVTTGPGQDLEIALSPDGRRMAFSVKRQNADIYKFPVDPRTGHPTGPPEKVVATTREDSRGAWSPDGRRVAFNSDRSGHMNLFIQDLESGSVEQVTHGPGGDYQPNWSPDMQSLIFFSSRSGSPGIWSVKLDGGAPRPLTKPSGMSVNPFYSPDGRHVAYQSDASGRLEVWVMAPDGTDARQLSDVGVGGHFLRWSPDGRFVIFRCPFGRNPGVRRISRDGGEPEALPNVAGGAHISLSPDGSRIMDVLAHKVLWVSPVGEGEPEKVFEFDDPDVRIDYPVWSPDGRWLLFDRFRPEGSDIWVMEGIE